MVISTNINKTYNHFKPQIIEMEKKKDHNINSVKSPCPARGQANKCGGVNSVNRIPPLFIIGSPMAIDACTAHYK